MSETKWTPGPYERSGTTVYALNGRGVNRITAQIQAGWQQKSFVRESPDDQRTTHEECKATAQLFTAAPELYEALNEMRGLWATICNAHGWDPDHMVQHAKAIAALAKARGETQ